jgi:hypothetical protein
MSTEMQRSREAPGALGAFQGPSKSHALRRASLSFRAVRHGNRHTAYLFEKAILELRRFMTSGDE